MNTIIRIVFTLIIVCFQVYGIFVIKNIWTQNIDIKKTLPNPFAFIQFKKTINIPKLDFSLQQLPSNFAEGIDVDGIIWETDFKQYLFKMKVKEASIQDLRVDIDFLGAVVKGDVDLQEGTSNIIISSEKFLSTGIGRGEQITKQIPAYSNNLKLSASQVFQDGYFRIKLIIKGFGDKDNGLVEISYQFIDKDENQKKWAYRFKILRNEHGYMFIDSDNPFKHAVTRSIQMIPKKPIVFKKDGSVEQKE